MLLQSSPVASIVLRRQSCPRGTFVWGLEEALHLRTVRAQQGLAPVGVGTRKVDDGTGKQELVGLGDGGQSRGERHGRRGAHVHSHLGGDLAEAGKGRDAVGHRAALVCATTANLGLDEPQRALKVATPAAERGVAAGANGAIDAPVVLGARGAAQRVFDQDVDHGLDGHRQQLRRPVGVVVGSHRFVSDESHLAIVQQRPVVASVAAQLAREPRAHGVHGDGLAVVGDGHLGLAGLGERHR